jgi:hypothetical protein
MGTKGAMEIQRDWFKSHESNRAQKPKQKVLEEPEERKKLIS